MKVKLSNIVPNPFRDPAKYPVDRDRVLRHKKRIQETGFWDNIVGRLKPGTDDTYELAYGLHRLEALHELGYEEIDLIVKDFNDIIMLKVMIRENEEDMQTRSVKHINESVEKAKETIEVAINEADGTWENLPEWCKELFDGKEGFQQASKASGWTVLGDYPVGYMIIFNFLGSEWSVRTIKEAMVAIAQKTTVSEENENGEKVAIPVEISREGLEMFQTPKHAEFAVNVFKSPIGRAAFPDKESQKQVITTILSDLEPDEKLSGSKVAALLQIEAQKVTDAEFIYEQKLPPVSMKEIRTITDDETHIEALQDVFNSNEGKIAFNTQRLKIDSYTAVRNEIIEENKVLNKDITEIPPELVAYKLKNKAISILADATPFAPDEVLSKETKTSLGKNRSYFTKSRSNFRTYVKSPFDIPLYKDWIAERDYYLLVADIGERVRLLKEYERFLGVKPILDKTVYNLYDRVDDEYNKLEDLWQDVEYDTEPELTIEEWFESDETYDDILGKLKSYRVY